MIIPIFSNIIVMTFYTVLNIGIIIVSPLHESLVPFLFTPPFLSNPIYRYLSQRECFLYLVSLIFFNK